MVNLFIDLAALFHFYLYIDIDVYFFLFLFLGCMCMLLWVILSVWLCFYLLSWGAVSPFYLFIYLF